MNIASNIKLVPLSHLKRDKSGPQSFPCSYSQQRLWFIHHLLSSSSAYHMHRGIHMKGRLNIHAFEQALGEILRRHESLRTTFSVVDGQPVQVINPAPNSNLLLVKLQGLSEAERERHVQRLAEKQLHCHFDLARGPLIRTTLLSLSETEHIFLFTMHHIVSDGWSIGVFMREMAALYNAFCRRGPSPLAELPIQYADYAVWQRQWLQGDVLQTQLNHWKQHLEGAPQVLELPSDRPRPPLQTFRGAQQSLTLSESLSRALKQLSRQESCTLFMTLLAAFKVLLHRYTGQDDIVIGTPVANRNRIEIEPLIGFFINTLALRVNLSGNPSFQELLGRVREVFIEAFTNQDVPFEKLLEELQPDRDMSRTPMVQVFFNMLNLEIKQFQIQGLEVHDMSFAKPEPKFDLILYSVEKDQRIRFDLVYNTDLFDGKRMIEMLEQFMQLLTRIVEHPEQKIAAFSLVTTTSKSLLPNPTEPLSYEWEGAVHTRFSQRNRRVPAHTAVIDTTGALSYEQLDNYSNQLANYLHSNGIQSQNVVAIYGHRSASLVWAMLGVLKAGGAFMVLEPAYPAARLIDCLGLVQPHAFVQLEEAGELPEGLEKFTADIPCLKLPHASVAGACDMLSDYSADDPGIMVGPDDLAYVAFTSGSTGRPKAIAGTHRPLSHFLRWYCETFGLNQSDRFSMLSGISHDPILRDVFAPLWLGATLCVPEQKDIENPGHLVKWMKKQNISITHLTPAMGQLLCETTSADTKANDRLTSIRYAFFGGDVLKKRDSEQIYRLAPSATCVNFYGATETPQAVGYFIVPKDTSGKSNEEKDGESFLARFETQVRRFPDKTAVKSDNNSLPLSYDSLNRHANRVAHMISEKYDDRFKLTKPEKIRYVRQLLLDDWGLGSQEILKSTTVFVAGAGGSGSPLLIQLALCGFGTIIVCDYDEVDLSNLNRQCLHDESRIGMNKSESAKISISKINPNINIIAHSERVTRDNIHRLVGDASIIFDEVDDLETKFILSECAVDKQIPHIISSMIDINSYAAIFHTPKTPCFHCMYDRNKLDEIEEMKRLVKDYKKRPNPVASPPLFLSTGFVCTEAIKIIVGFENIAYNKYFYFNQKGKNAIDTDCFKIITFPFSDHFRKISREQGLSWEEGREGDFLEEILIKPDPECPICSDKARASSVNTGENKKSTVNVGISNITSTVPERTQLSEQDNETPQNKQTIALLLGHEADMVVGIISALKSGKIYVPLDPDYPNNKLVYMLDDSEARIIVTDDDNLDLAERLKNEVNKHIKIVNINTISETVSSENLGIENKPEQIAYILYDWDSDKQPKRIEKNYITALSYINACTYNAYNDLVDNGTTIQKQNIPLGRGIEDVQLLILNEMRQLAGIAEVGEIHVRTPYLAKGYLNNDELTRRQFILNPFTKTKGDRLYRTGDMARYLPDGRVEFIGRIDRQVKIRGFRIELEEIERVLSGHEAVDECVVMVSTNELDAEELIGFIVSKDFVSSLPLRRFLKEILPDYMIPSKFVQLDEIPFTPNGKVDYKALDALKDDSVSEVVGYMQPNSRIEKLIAEIWQDVLGVKKVGLNDNFFDLGGHSLLVTRIIPQIEDKLKIKVLFRDFFNQTLAQLAASCEEKMIENTPENVS